ncbi:hypothetical protein ACNKHK_03720 [Shigella flexneri]
MAPAFLYLSLAIIVCGYGLFKLTLVACWASYMSLTIRVATVDSLCSTSRYIGSIIAPIACGYVQEEYSWAMGFALAAIGMLQGR